MSDPEKPLHVRVAEVLGCSVLERDDHLRYRCGCDNAEHQGETWDSIARYDTAWSATGPLIEEHRIEMRSYSILSPDLDEKTVEWAAYADERNATGVGPTPPVAVCNLIIALAESGKLK